MNELNDISMFPTVEKIRYTLTTESYFDLLTPINLYARKCDTKDKYFNLYCSSLKQISGDKRKYMEDIVLPRVNNVILDRIIPFHSVSFCEFSNIESNMPHTLGNIIFLPSSFWNHPVGSQVNTVRHELVHIFQRRYKEDTDKFIQEKLGYRIWGYKNMFNDIRINPDTCYAELYQHVDTGNVYAPCFVSDKPSSVRDIVVKCVVGKNISSIAPIEYEHPYEEMAYFV